MKKILTAVAALTLISCNPSEENTVDQPQTEQVERPSIILPSDEDFARELGLTDDKPFLEYKKGSDGFDFTRKQFILPDNEITVRAVYYTSENDITVAFNMLKSGLPLVHAQGFTYMNTDDGVCEIHVLDPMASYQPQIAGHELFHCLHGNFHD